MTNIIRNEVTTRDGEPFREIDIEDPPGAVSEMGWRIDVRSEDVVRAARDIIARKSAAEFDGVLIDYQTAHVIVAVWDALSEPARTKFEEMTHGDAAVIGTLCWKVANNAQAKAAGR